VAITLDDLSIQQNVDGNGDIRVYVQITEDELEAMPSYE